MLNQILKELQELRQDHDKLQEELIVCKKEISVLKEQLQYKDETRLERYYQKYLEKKYNGTHRKTSFGFSDIENDDVIIEIKNWKKYKECLGQLITYTSETNEKKQKIAYFFGDKPSYINKVLLLFSQHNIAVHHTEVINGQVLDEMLIEHNQPGIHTNDMELFQNWLIKNVIYKENGVLKLQECVERCLGVKIGPRQLGKYKNHVESFLKTHFPCVDHTYKQFWLGNQTYKGWRHVQLVNLQKN